MFPRLKFVRLNSQNFGDLRLKIPEIVASGENDRSSWFVVLSKNLGGETEREREEAPWGKPHRSLCCRNIWKHEDKREETDRHKFSLLRLFFILLFIISFIIFHYFKLNVTFIEFVMRDHVNYKRHYFTFKIDVVCVSLKIWGKKRKKILHLQYFIWAF